MGPCRAVRIGFLFMLLTLHHVAALQITTAKFRYWFPSWSSSHLGTIMTDECRVDAQDYWYPSATNDTYPWKCARLLDCVLNNTSPSTTQEIASSMVVLGLTPSMLFMLGPNIAETSMISFQSPLLALMLAFGSPGVPVSRILTYDDPLDAIKSADLSSASKPWSNTATILGIISGRRMRRHQWLISLLKYFFALAAILNTVEVSLDLGIRSVSIVSCNSWYLALMWVLLASTIHLIGALSFWLRSKKVDKTIVSTTIDITALDFGEKRVIRSWAPSIWTLIISGVSGLSAVAHLILGTLVFSSFMFLDVIDAIPIIARYAASAFICRLISQYELALLATKYLVKYETLKLSRDMDSEATPMNSTKYSRQPDHE